MAGLIGVVEIRWAFEEFVILQGCALGQRSAERRDTLLAKPTNGGYAIDVRLQGPGETVFFDL